MNAYIEICTDCEGFDQIKHGESTTAWPRSEHVSEWGAAFVFLVPAEWVTVDTDQFGVFYCVNPKGVDNNEVA